ncbi:MAG: glutamate--tRNA ligase [Candidatus Taylorbacteria bacterium]|nr:glutamate--tRNA ligase [Candidatus Taylorbacteria bacterium]
MIRVRIAPSPTGNLHIGTARTALFNWLFAHKYKGEFILRIEDTDLERSDKKYEKDIMEGLKWLGLDWSNEEIIRQSERLDIYEQYLKKLLDSGKAFWCDHSKEELEQENNEQRTQNQAPRHICSHKAKNLKNGQIIRLAVNTNSKEKISFNDAVRGNIEWEEGLLGNFSLAKNLKTPLYNFAAVVDDIDMKISHVIRGEDHISNTPKQILIYQALGSSTSNLEVELPSFAHIPLTLGSDRSKLSKRHGATSINEYRKDYLPEAMINFMGFLGYTYSKEILTKEEMAEEFELEKVHKSGAIFDVKKLNWINSQYIRRLGTQELRKLTGNEKIPEKALPLITERLEKLSDVQNFDYFWKDPEYDKELLKWKKFSLEDSKKSLEKVKEIISNHDFKNKDELREKLDDLAKEIGDPATGSGQGRGLVYWPLRVALTGKDKSPDPIDIAYVLGKEKTLERVINAMI